jgi:hypothetical protein
MTQGNRADTATFGWMMECFQHSQMAGKKEVQNILCHLQAVVLKTSGFIISLQTSPGWLSETT